MSCPSVTDCTAVGHSSIGSTTKTLVEHWNGASWSIVPSPNPSSAEFKGNVLNAVSRPSSTNCNAVGSYNAPEGTVTLVEHWNGATWSIVASPNRSGASANTLTGVSCRTSTSCTAVGLSAAANGISTLVERYA